jgi:cytochrome c553
MMIKSLPTLKNMKRSVKTGSLLLSLLVLLPFMKSQAQTPEAAENWKVCAACHSLGTNRLIGPGLEGVTERLDQEWLIRFIRNSQEVIASGDEYAVALFEEYNRIPMPPNDLSDEAIIDLLKYIESGGQLAPEYAEAETEAVEKSPELLRLEAKLDAREQQLSDLKRDANRKFGTTFMITLIILLVVLADLFLTKVIKARFVHITIILIGVAIIAEITYKEATALGRQQYYQPDQPIWFSHKIHAEQNQIDCMYCHTTVEDSKHAGFPSVGLCMNCHNVVREGKITGRTEIDKIHAAWESGQPVEWIKIHNLPDHVYFNHAQHVAVGKMDCAQCHGPVEKMDEVMQVENLSMGWCIDCHRTTEVQFTNNLFYEQYKQLHEELHAGKRSRVTVDDIGGNECQKCHY